jgi:hypothetical protein
VVGGWPAVTAALLDEVEGWLLGPGGPVHRTADVVHRWQSPGRARCFTDLRGAVSCTVLAARVHKIPLCLLCFPGWAPARTGAGVKD